MKQYNLQTNDLTLRVKKSPFLVRLIMFFFTSLFFLAPLVGMVIAISSGKKFHIAYVISIGIFSLLGFYLLRISLWNTYGHERVVFNGTEVTYNADYGWFNDAVKKENITPLSFRIHPIGYEEDKMGVLVIGTNDSKIECVTKMPISEITELIEKLNNL